MSEGTSPAIAILETLALRGWPALEVEPLDGWLLRASNGFTKRANSVNALKAPVTSLDRRIGVAEQFYADRKLPTVFRITPLSEPELDPALDRRGYQFSGASEVMVANQLPANDIDPNVTIDAICTDQWMAGFVAANQYSDVERQTLAAILSQIGPRSAFASIGDKCFARATVEAGYVGIFSVVTAPDARQRGFARRISNALMTWGQSRGARRAYLQVEVDNLNARTLYQSLGFQKAYDYHYRIAPQSSAT